jgi:hypothetical protein
MEAVTDNEKPLKRLDNYFLEYALPPASKLPIWENATNSLQLALCVMDQLSAWIGVLEQTWTYKIRHIK